MQPWEETNQVLPLHAVLVPATAGAFTTANVSGGRPFHHLRSAAIRAEDSRHSSVGQARDDCALTPRRSARRTPCRPRQRGAQSGSWL